MGMEFQVLHENVSRIANAVTAIQRLSADIYPLIVCKF